ncbi:MAG TPA: ISNCY family transposase [Polyangiales bacterium]|jgi:transposase
MKVSEVIEKALRREIRWLDAADILGITPRQMHRWKQRLQSQGPRGLCDARVGKEPKNRVPDAVSQKVLELYRGSYAGFNVQHFHEQLAEHGIVVSYGWTKNLLHEAGLVERGRRRKAYRRRRDRAPMRGMLVHLDGSKHRWFDAGDGSMQDLLAFVDDATGEILSARFVREEGTRTVLALMRELIEERGTFGRLYTDRASHFVVTPTAGLEPDRTKKSQVERVLDDLGIELVCAFSPQARGRSERLWRTLQGRLPNELARADIHDYDAANGYLRGRFKRGFNQRFAVAPAVEDETGFVPVARADLDRIFTLRFERTVSGDHTLRFHNRVLQLDKPRGASPLQRRVVQLRLTLDGRIDVYLGTRLLQSFEARDLDLDDPALAA